jgi:hypothetical protein
VVAVDRFGAVFEEPMADTLMRMRVLQAGTNNDGSHQVGDEITVDAAHAELFELIGFAERLDAIHVTTVIDYRHAEAETDAARRNRRRTR